MANGIAFNNSSVFAGLGTASFTIAAAQAGPVTVAFESFLPYQAAGSSNNSSVTTGGSSLSVVVNLNGSAKLTVDSPSPSQPSLAGTVRMLCVSGDVITVVMSSSNANDNLLNAAKTVINLYQGE